MEHGYPFPVSEPQEKNVKLIVRSDYIIVPQDENYIRTFIGVIEDIDDGHRWDWVNYYLNLQMEDGASLDITFKLDSDLSGFHFANKPFTGRKGESLPSWLAGERIKRKKAKLTIGSGFKSGDVELWIWCKRDGVKYAWDPKISISKP